VIRTGISLRLHNVTYILTLPPKEALGGSFDKSMKLWDITTGTGKQTLTGRSEQRLLPLLISLSDQWVFMAGDNLLWLPTYYRSLLCHAPKDPILYLTS
jgi:hypothetical protein